MIDSNQIIPSVYIKNQSNNDLEEWLKYNKPTVLKHGESTATGFTRYVPESKKVEPKPKVKKEIKYLPWSEYEAFCADFDKRAGYGDRVKFCRHIGMSVNFVFGRRGIPMRLDGFEKVKQGMETFVFRSEIPKPQPKPRIKKVKKVKIQRVKKVKVKTEEAIRIENNVKARLEAITGGLDHFMGECKHHGKTVFKLRSSTLNARCPKCHDVKRYLRCLFPRLHDRIVYNRELHRQATEQHKTTFIGSCEKHNMTTFKIRGSSHKCTTCEEQSNIKHRAKKGAVLKVFTEKQMCRLEASERKIKALKEGVKKYEGLCLDHGYTTYTVYKQHSRCNKCTARNDKRTRTAIENKPIVDNRKKNRELMKAELKRNPESKRFTGTCLKHGNVPFLIKKAINVAFGFSPACSVCKKGK